MEKIPAYLLPLVQKCQLLNSDKKPLTLDFHQVCSLPTHGYEATLRAGQLKLSAASLVGLATGFVRAQAGYHSGHLDEFLGHHQPRTTQRILWVTDGQHPDPLRIVELGFNALLTHHKPTQESLDAYHSLGISVGYACHVPEPITKRCPLHEDDAVQEILGEIAPWDFVLWPSQMAHPSFLQHPRASDYTVLEMVIEEIRLVEKHLPKHCRLIYRLPYTLQEDTDQLLDICQQTSVTLAFSTVSGPPEQQHLPESPLWTSLRRYRDHEAPLPFIPIIDAGNSAYGQGFWPALGLMSSTRTLSHMRDQGITSLIATTPHVPQNDGFLACRLWTLGHAAWSQSATHRLAHTWFAAYRPAWTFVAHQDAMHRVDSVAAALAHLAAQQPRGSSIAPGYLEATMGQLKQLEHEYADSASSQSQHASSLPDYFRYFCRDACCLLHFHIDRLRLPAAGVATAYQHDGGFWTALASFGGKAIPSSATVTLLQQPRCSDTDPAMRLIYDENRPTVM